MNTIARLLLPVDGAHAACCEQMAAAMGNAEGAALKGLQMCIDTIMAEVCPGFFLRLYLGLALIKKVAYSPPICG